MNYLALPILLFYLLIFSRYKKNLINCDLRDMFDKNILLDHITGLLTIYIFIIMVRTPSKQNDIFENLYYSIICYTIFLVSTRLDLPILLLLVLLGISSYHIDIKISQLSKQSNINELNKYKLYRKYLQITMFTILIIGYIYYTVRKVNKQGMNFSLFEHIFGQAKCD